MIIGRLLGLELDKGDEHISTTWEIATDYSFKNIISSSVDDTSNLESIIIKDITPEQGKEYYGRARIRTRLSGWSNWHNLDIAIAEKQDSVTTINTLPSVIGCPRIITKYNSKDCNPSEHPVNEFEIHVSGYATVNNTKHTATSWYIEDMDKSVIWKSENNVIDKTSISISDIILEYNKVYKIRVCFHSETRDVSDLSTLTICTFDENNIALRIYFDKYLIMANPDVTNNITLDLPILIPEGSLNPGEVCLYMDILEYNTLPGSKVAFSKEVTYQEKQVIIPGNTLRKNRSYLLRYKVSKDDNWEVLLWSIW